MDKTFCGSGMEWSEPEHDLSATCREREARARGCAEAGGVKDIAAEGCILLENNSLLEHQAGAKRRQPVA